MNQDLREHMQDRRLFFLYKPYQGMTQSFTSQGLHARFALSIDKPSYQAGDSIAVSGKITNVGSSLWSPSVSQLGPVRLSAQIKREESNEVVVHQNRVNLNSPKPEGIFPGDAVPVEFQLIAPLDRGSYVIEADLVAENVA